MAERTRAANATPSVVTFALSGQRAASINVVGSQLAAIICLSSHVASMPQRVPTRLRPHCKTVRLAPDRNPVRQLSGRSVEHVNLVVVAPRYPELLSIRRNITHVGTPAARNWPGRDDR